MKQVQAEDERGRGWVIYENDSAWDLCSTLAKAGVAQVVLPSVTYLSGSLPEIEIKRFDNVSAASMRQFPDVATAVRRQVRLQDCLEFLRRQEEPVVRIQQEVAGD